MKCKLVAFILVSMISCHFTLAATTRDSNKRQARQVISAGASTLAVDSYGTPVMTTAVDAMGGTSGSVVGGIADPLGLGLGMTHVVQPGGVGLGTTLMDTSGVGLGVGLTATIGEAVGNFYDLITAYSFTPVDTSNSFYILPPNLQAYIPDNFFLIQSPPTYDSYIFACDIYGTGMCYYYYYNLS